MIIGKIIQEVDVMKEISRIKAAWEEVSDQDGVLQTLEQDEYE